MGSTGKTRTTRAKLNREAKLREKRVEKQARKAARRLSASGDDAWLPPGPEEPGTESVLPDGSGADAQRSDPEP